jgi:GH24 family phage-related lysozyme (muramidase)
LRLNAYQDSKGVWTIGYGHTGNVDGKPVVKGMTITPEKASELLDTKIKEFEKHVNSFDETYDWEQNEFDALVCFAYNIGSINALTNKGKRTKQEIAQKIPAYCNCNKKYVVGLYIRRLKEALLFVKGA